MIFIVLQILTILILTTLKGNSIFKLFSNSDVRSKMLRKPLIKMQTQKRPDSKDKNVRDSPYVSNYPSKISKRKYNKEESSSKESLGKIAKKKDYKFKRKNFIVELFIGNSKRNKNDILGFDSGKASKNSQLKSNTNTMSKKIKVKSVSQNNRKKSKKSNFNNTFKDVDLIESLIKLSNPVKNSQSKLNQTMAVYDAHNYQYIPSKHSNREYINQSQNSRTSKKKGLNYMKQMMNKTVLIQNHDYQIFGKPIADRRSCGF